MTTQAHQNLICSPAGNILFFKALEQNKADFVKLFIQQNIDLMESEKTTGRILNLFKTRFVNWGVWYYSGIYSGKDGR